MGSVYPSVSTNPKQYTPPLHQSVACTSAVPLFIWSPYISFHSPPTAAPALASVASTNLRSCIQRMHLKRKKQSFGVTSREVRSLQGFRRNERSLGSLDINTGTRTGSMWLAVRCSWSSGAFAGVAQQRLMAGGKLLVMAPLSEALGPAYLWAPPENCFLIKIALSRGPGPLY